LGGNGAKVNRRVVWKILPLLLPGGRDDYETDMDRNPY
tara:strand:+ start:803 stop:916 length:114 start_codon:yes stop_codon:yes gene_type:complete